MRKVLLIEDEPAIADNVVYALQTEGFTPVWCATGEEGRRQLAEGGFDLVLLDIGLPDGSGLELCKEIRRASALPVIFLTARHGELDRVVGLEIGGDDYVVKPFSPRELTARVKAVLRRAEAPAPTAPPTATAAPRAIGPFTIDHERHVITYHGHALKLSRHEFRLLDVFLGKPGRVFSRAQLMDGAWDEPEASLERTVDAHVKNLRGKLRETSPAEDPIRTHRGVGYSIELA